MFELPLIIIIHVFHSKSMHTKRLQIRIVEIYVFSLNFDSLMNELKLWSLKCLS